MSENTRQGLTVAYSKTLGLVPCVVVGSNDSHCLVKLYGKGKVVSLPSSIVFALEEGWGLGEGNELVFQYPHSDRPATGGEGDA